MAITTVSSHVVSVNAIQGTLIADNAITAVHIATNAVSGTLIADNAVTAVHVAQNSITVTQLADDCVESDKIADGVITTNHLNKAMISSQTEVTPVAGDFVLLGDTSDSNNLKKAPLTLLLNSNVDLSTKLNLSGGTLTGGIVVGGDSSINRGNQTAGELLLGGTTDGGFVDFDGTSLQLNTQRDPNTGTFINTSKSHGGITIVGGDADSHIKFYTKDANNTVATERMRIDKSGKVIIGDTQSSAATDLLQIETPASGGGHGIQIRRNDSNGDQGIGRIMFGNNNDTDLATISSVTDGQADCARLVFSTQPTSGNSTERMRIDSAGTIFQGTTSPTLHSATTGIVFTNGSLLTDIPRAASRSITLAQNAAVDSGNTFAYLVTDEASAFQQFNGNHYFMTAASGSAGADVTFDTKMMIHNSGCIDLGANVTSPGRSLGTNITTTVTSGSAGSGFWMSTGNSSATSTKLISYQNGSVGEFKINQGSGVNGGTIVFSINDSNKMNVLSNGVVLIGTDTQSGISNGTTNFGFSFGGGGQMVSGTSNDTNIILNRSGGSGNMILIRNNGSTIGAISQNGSTITYGGTSDYRLKENITDMTNATTRLKQLKPKRFNFIADESNTLVDGFLAHEVSSIVPEAVVGEKDAEDLQMMDNSKLVPLLVKTIQELETRIATLEG